MNTKSALRLLVVLVLPACIPGVVTPRLSRAPLPPGLTLRQAAFAATITYFDNRFHGRSGRATIAFMGVDAADLPPSAPVAAFTGHPDSILVEYDSGILTQCPSWRTNPLRTCTGRLVLDPTSVRFTPDSLGVAIGYEIGGPDRTEAASLELRRRPGCEWTFWRLGPPEAP